MGKSNRRFLYLLFHSITALFVNAICPAVGKYSTPLNEFIFVVTSIFVKAKYLLRKNVFAWGNVHRCCDCYENYINQMITS
mmetsp:Transcript_5033/g.6565  ORF Transcript_5033/g.6565 Transcript_5033/m.6565 type:complete len:81 (-) Transcript_5033:2439-2681(-)